MKIYKGIIKTLKPNEIFVFGSNTEGRHGGGAAKAAMQWGAVYGQARGLQGQTYAIVTKDLSIGFRSISKFDICSEIVGLYQFADKHPNNDCLIAYSGTGQNLNGYTNEEMTRIFRAAATLHEELPTNIVFEAVFASIYESLT